MENHKIEEYLEGLSKIDLCTALFKQGNFDFIVKGFDEEGNPCEHFKQREALEILTSNDCDEFLYGGAAGGAKSWTGCVWILFMAIIYPNTRYYIARNELKDIVDSVYVTFIKVAREYGFTDFKYNAVKNWINLGNGSHINLIEVKYKPSDPLYEDLGSTEYTSGWIEEIGEINERAATVLLSRTGRHLNHKYGIRGKAFYTCNPKKNWAKMAFYDKDKNGTLEEYKRYLPCLITENPFIEKQYVENLRKLAQKDKALYERLFKGNWDYEESDDLLCEYSMIEQVFDNNHLQEGISYLTCDVARFGSDKAVIMVWLGWICVEMLSFNISKTTDIEHSIMLLRRKYKIPKNRCIGDADGVGGGVIDGSGILGFVNNGKPIKQKGKDENYTNLKTQCYYLLADKINEGGIWYNCELSNKEKSDIKQEFDQIRSRNLNDRKLGIKNKKEIKEDIGRSPDYSDTAMMRVFFDLKPTKRKGMLTRKRNSL